MKRASDEIIEGVGAMSVGDPGTPVPEGWRRVRLLDVARMESGHTPSRKHPEYWDGDVPWVGIVDARLHHGTTIQDTIQKVTETGLDNSAARWLPAKTVCLSRTASVGYVTVLGRPMATSQDFVCWVCSDELEPEFLKYALMSEGEHIKEFGMGTTHTTIYFPAALAFHIKLPPVSGQRRIVEKVGALLAEVNTVMQRLERVRHMVKRYRQALLVAACSGDLTRDWRMDQPGPLTYPHLEAASNALPDYIDHVNERDWPASWRLCRADTLVSIQNGRAFPSKEYCDDGIRLLRPGNMNASGYIEYNDENTTCLPMKWQESARDFVLRDGELLMNLTAQSLKDEFLGRTCVKLDTQPALLNQRIARFRNHGEHDLRPYLLLYFKSIFFRAFVDGLDTGTLIRHMHSKDVARHVVPIPPLEEQTEIVSTVARLMSAANAIERRINVASAGINRAPQAIFDKAFHGDL